MFLFPKKRFYCKTAIFAVLVLLLGYSLLISCEQPGGGITRVNARQPIINVPPAGGSWDVSGEADTFLLTVSASSPDGGIISFQWYSNSNPSNTGGIPLGAPGEDPDLILKKPDYASNGTRCFYVVVRNTISNNGDGGSKTTALASSVVLVNVTGNKNIGIISSTDLAKIGNDENYPLSGTYVLESDITLADWIPIGSEAEPFSGIFNGNGKLITLTGFSAAALSEKSYFGIFGFVKGSSSMAKTIINDLKISSSVDQKSTGAKVVGLAAGYAELAEIGGIILSGTFTFETASTVRLGGIAGSIVGETLIKNSSSSMNMKIIPGSGSQLPDGGGPYNYIGGFIGMFKGGAGIENCHNSGNVTVDNTVSSASGQIFTGGITGGSLFSYNTVFQGYICDSSSTGIITGKADDSWTFAGGIAGTITGGTAASLEQTTRIERCYASGTVSVEGTNSDFPYAGGIVGYNYYGALVSQSCFNGTVISDKENDYTGGFAGYNSQTAAPNYSRIEDCWSSGTVQGYENAGGIVGQNQALASVKRCYSTSEIIVTSDTSFGAGGIVGLLGTINGNSGVADCAALNPSIKLSGAGTGVNIHRIFGIGDGESSNNYAWKDMVITLNSTYNPEKGLAGADGEDLDSQKPQREFYETELGWNFTNIWEMDISDEYPVLSWQK